MKFRYVLIVFLLNFFLVNFIFTKKSLAAACTANVSPTANCTGPLTITQNVTEIINNFVISSASSSGIYNIGHTIGLIKNSSSSSSIIGSTGVSGGGIYSTGIITTIDNFGLINDTNGDPSIYNNGGTMSTITNESGATIGTGIYNTGAITTISNIGTIRDDLNTNYVSGQGGNGIANIGGTITSITNSGSLSGAGQGGIYNTGTIGTNLTNGINNSGTIQDLYGGSGIENNNGTITSIINTSTGTINGGSGSYGYNGVAAPDEPPVGIYNTGTITQIINSNLITGSIGGIYNNGGTITTITNNLGATIRATNAGSYGIKNLGTITTLNNAQSSLTYTGRLPQYYNIILGTNASSFGTLVVTSPSNYNGASGKTTFGINSGTITTNKYTGVITGVSTSYLSATTGTYSGYNWSLSLQSGSTTDWDLLFATFISSTDTDTSLLTVASDLKGVINYQNSSLNSSLNYDCYFFGKSNSCISGGVRNGSTKDNETQSIAIIAATKINDQVRVGGYIDGAVNKNYNSNMKLNSNSPMFGVFARFNQHDPHFGLRGGVSAGYVDQDLKSTRVATGTSEPGTGTSNLITKGIQAELQYGIDAASFLTISPYLGYRNTQTTRSKYTEETSTTVTTPLTYNKIKQNEETAFVGIELKSHFHTTDTFATLNLGYEHAAKFSIDNLLTTGISGTSDINLGSNIDKTRPVLMASLNQDLGSSGRLSLNFDRRQQVYSPTNSTNVALQYMVGF